MRSRPAQLRSNSTRRNTNEKKSSFDSSSGMCSRISSVVNRETVIKEMPNEMYRRTLLSNQLKNLPKRSSQHKRSSSSIDKRKSMTHISSIMIIL